MLSADGTKFSKGAYCLGKVVWGKGWEELIKLLEHCKKTQTLCSSTVIDCYGDGEARKTVSDSECGLESQVYPKVYVLSWFAL